ncbi:MAG: BC10 family protein [Akkermansia sp.]|nr:BC10 family protein [Akkermansia sp.]
MSFRACVWQEFCWSSPFLFGFAQPGSPAVHCAILRKKLHETASTSRLKKYDSPPARAWPPRPRMWKLPLSSRALLPLPSKHARCRWLSVCRACSPAHSTRPIFT